MALRCSFVRNAWFFTLMSSLLLCLVHGWVAPYPVQGAAPPQELSSFTTKTFQADGEIFEFVQFSGDNQAYFVVDPALEATSQQFGAIKVGAMLTRGVFVVRDNFPLSGSPNQAGLSGFRDRPGVAGTVFVSTGFNIGRAFGYYNPNAFGGEGAYFLAMDISAPAIMDSIAGTQPVAFDIDGDGNLQTQSEIDPGVISEAPTRVAAPDVYGFALDTNVDGFPEVSILILERRQAVRFGEVPIDPGGVAQVIDGVIVRRSIYFEDSTGTLPGSPEDQAVMFLDANQDGVVDHYDIGVGSDIEVAIRNVGLLPGNTNPACVNVLFLADSFDDQSLGGGAEDLVEMELAFPVPQIEVVKDARCIDEPDTEFRRQLRAVPGSTVEFRVTVQNLGNRDLDVTLQDSLSCLAPATTTFLASSCLVTTAPVGFDSGVFCAAFESAALTSPEGFVVPLGVFEAADDCAVGLGDQLVFTFRVDVGPPGINPGFCDDDIDCTHSVSVMGVMLMEVDPILPPDPLSVDSPDGNAEEEDCGDDACCTGVDDCIPNDGVGDVEDEFSVTVQDQASEIDTVGENGEAADNNVVEIEIECREITLNKEIRLLPDGPFVSGDTPLMLPTAPLELEYRYTVENVGEVDEAITITEGFICDDINQIVTTRPGEAAYVDCPICTEAPLGQFTGLIPSGGTALQTRCSIRLETQGAVEDFLQADDVRPDCRAESPTGEADESCYLNCASADASATNLNRICRDDVLNTESTALVCQDVCEIGVNKQVLCLDNCTDHNPVGGAMETVEAVAGACLEFQVDITNNSGDQAVCAIQIRDTLFGQTAHSVYEGGVTFVVGATTCTVPAGFNVNGTPFLWDPTVDCGLPALGSGETLTITFGVSIPSDADPAVTPINTVVAEGAAFCPPSGPALTCIGREDAAVDIVSTGLICMGKEWAVGWDMNVNCAPDSLLSDFSSEIDLRASVFPALLRLRVRAQNTGETALDVTVADTALAECIAATEGVNIVEPPTCELGIVKTLAPSQVGEWLCDLRVDTADALRVLDTCDGAEDGVYVNRATVAGTLVSDNGAVCIPELREVPADGDCSARVLTPPPCDLQVTKEVACADDGVFTSSTMASPDSAVTFRIHVENTGSAVKLPKVCLTDVLSCNDWLVGGSISAMIEGDDVSACAAAELSGGLSTGDRVCLTFGACRSGSPWIAPGETLAIAFDVHVPSGFDALGQNPDCTNEVTVEGYEDVCTAIPPVEDACDVGNGQSEFNVVVPRLECEKLVCLDLDNDGVCDEPQAEDIVVAANMPFPLSLIYQVSTRNTGEAPLMGVQTCDDQLPADAMAAGLLIAGDCDLSGAPGGCSTTFNLNPSESEFHVCRIEIPSRAAWEAFAVRDNDGDEECYRNMAQSSGLLNTSMVCKGSVDNVLSPGCTSRACLPPPLTGACCNIDGTCDLATELECMDRPGSTYGGDNTSCLGDSDGNGIDDACEEPIPTVSEWGLIILLLLLLTAAKLRFGPRFKPAMVRI